MKTRKGTKTKVIKNHEVIAVCENIGDASRLTEVCRSAIRKRMKDGLATNGYQFQEVK